MAKRNDLQEFVKRIKSFYNDDEVFSIENARMIVKEINDFLYTTYDDIGKVDALGAQYQFLSEFHRYWNDNYKEILDAEINEERCEQVADALFYVYEISGGEAFSGVYDTYGLTKEDICKVRMLTANQDFRGSRAFKDLAEIFKGDSSIFDVKVNYSQESGHVFMKKPLRTVA